ncbi:hypothetical protein B2J93_6759 [Marssonina coronariae]|uniref:Uncharacterized protein n=1 Tax=Diplocarpon coronariae TaxID=2795749 RepID=A0A218Z696_9HELO|nr:hypothetical protein B2J93_6759 [Marssonina coronariae]
MSSILSRLRRPDITFIPTTAPTATPKPVKPMLEHRIPHSAYPLSLNPVLAPSEQGQGQHAPKCAFCGSEHYMVACEIRIALLAAEREMIAREVAETLAHPPPRPQTSRYPSRAQQREDQKSQRRSARETAREVKRERKVQKERSTYWELLAEGQGMGNGEVACGEVGKYKRCVIL